MACGSSKEVSSSVNNPIIQDNANTNSTDLADTPARSIPEDTVNTEQKRREQLTELYKEELTDQYQADANGLINFYILAQQRFFSRDYQNALILINRAAEIKENADVLALKGSIYLGLGQTENFVANWRQALELDAEVPIPPIPYIAQQLQLNGLLDENLQKAF